MERAVAELTIKLRPVLDDSQVRRALRELESRTLRVRYLPGLAGVQTEPMQMLRQLSSLFRGGELAPSTFAGVIERARAAASGAREMFIERARAASQLTSAYSQYVSAVSSGIAVEQALLNIRQQYGEATSKAVQELARLRMEGYALGDAMGQVFRSFEEFSRADLLSGAVQTAEERVERLRELAERARGWTPAVEAPQPAAAAAAATTAAAAAAGTPAQAAATATAAAATATKVWTALGSALKSHASAAVQAVGAQKAVSGLASALARLRGALDSVLAAIRKQRLPKIPRVGEDAELLGALAALRVVKGETKSATIAELTRLIRATVEYTGAKVAPSMVRIAAYGVESGQLSIAEAVRALVMGATQYKSVLRDAGLAAEVTAKNFRDLTRAMKLAAIASGKIIPAKETPLLPSVAEELPPAGQALAIGQAMATAAQKTQGFWKSLLTLRWEIFTVMFFLYGVTRAVTALFKAVDEGSKVLAATRSAVRGLAAAGVEDIPQLVAELRDAAGGFYTVIESATRLSALYVAGLPRWVMEYAPELMRIARAIAALRGTDVEDVFKAITESIIRGEFRLARTAGALVGTLEDLHDEFLDYVQSLSSTGQPVDELTQRLINLGITQAQTTGELTAQQKQYLILWGIMRHGQRVVRALGEDFDRERAAIQMLKTSIEELKLAAESYFASKLAPAAEWITKQIYREYGIREYARRTFGSFDIAVETLARAGRYIPELGASQNILLYLATRLSEKYKQLGYDAKTAMEMAEREAEDMVIELGRVAFVASVLGIPADTRDTYSDAGVRVRMLADELRETELAFEGAQDAADDFSQSLWSMSTSAIIDSLQAAARAIDQWRYEDRERAIRWQREDEDLERRRNERLTDAEREYNDRRRQAQREFMDRTEEARRDYARRLAQIERDLANELLSIWEDYYYEFWQYELERDALSALLAARRRDQRIAEAQREAELRRQEAYDAYIDAIENAQRRHEQEMAQLREQYNQRLQEIADWYNKELEEQRIARQRELEDAQRAREREREELMKDLLLRLTEIQIANAQQLTEQEKFHALAYAILVRYSGLTVEETSRMLSALVNNWQQGISRLPAATQNVFQQILALRNFYAQLLQQPIVIPVVYSVYPPGGYQVPPPSPRQQPIPRAEGGVDIVRRPTLFLAGERGPEVAVFVPLNKIGPVQGHFAHAVQAVVTSQVAGLDAKIENAVLRAIQEVFR